MLAAVLCLFSSVDVWPKTT
uniref:Uncharacterized protein n=1 Tax=Rhizophora mucronata TaxID=61149 RepID=A0A2P2Q4D9_RHIMU